MNSPTPQDPWARLVRAARSSGPREDYTAPFGFATRVVARSAETSALRRSFVEVFAFRAVAIAALLALGSFGVELTRLSPPLPSGEQVDPGADDALSALVDA